MSRDARRQYQKRELHEGSEVDFVKDDFEYCIKLRQAFLAQVLESLQNCKKILEGRGSKDLKADTLFMLENQIPQLKGKVNTKW